MLPAALLSLLLAAGEPSAPAGPRCASFDLSLAGIGSAEEDLARVAGLAGSAPLWPGVLRRPSGSRPLWLCDGPAPAREALADPLPLDELRWELVPPTSFSKLHTGWADDRNDGALWSGRGLSTEASAGARARWRWFTLQLAPLAAWQQNRAWDVPASTLPGFSPYANPFAPGAIDLPLRMGPGPFWTVDWGQSVIRADAWNAAIGLSTENLWWGPGIRNALLMSNSAPGFPHLFVGTTRPLDIWIGWLEAELLWGRVANSKYFDLSLGARRNLFEAAVLTFEPAFARGLTLGYVRAFVFAGTDASAHHYLDPVSQALFKAFLKGGAGDGSSPDNQLLSLFFRWAFPEVQLEIYAEWGRDDHAFNLTDFLMEPGHSQAWLLGMQKLFPAGRRWVRFQAELAHTFEMPPAHPTRGTPIFYTHGSNGYTNAGQMIGAGLGPQGDTQFAAADCFTGLGSFGLYLERIVRNERWFYDQVAATGASRHDLQMTAGLRGALGWPEWDLEWDLAGSHRFAPNFGRPGPGLDAMLRLRWWPGRPEAPALPARGRGPVP
jgi:hypothetical protein